MNDENRETPEPAVGMPSTIVLHTDRLPATVVRVTAREVVVQEDLARRVDDNGMSEDQRYDYEPDPNGQLRRFTRRRDGRYWARGTATGSGISLVLGVRRMYHDFSF